MSTSSTTGILETQLVIPYCMRLAFRSVAEQIIERSSKITLKRDRKGEVCVYFGIFHQITLLCFVSTENV